MKQVPVIGAPRRSLGNYNKTFYVLLYMQYGTGPFLYPTSILLIKRQAPMVWRYQRGNQNPYIEEEQTTQ